MHIKSFFSHIWKIPEKIWSGVIRPIAEMLSPKPIERLDRTLEGETVSPWHELDVFKSELKKKSASFLHPEVESGRYFFPT
jgi:hypothetical protein